jgi:hypothetical protein
VLAIVRVFKAGVELLAMVYLGQATMYLVAASAREKNFAYRLFKRVTQPADRLIRHVTPRRILDRHLPFVSFALLSLLWVALTAWKIRLVLFAPSPGP